MRGARGAIGGAFAATAGGDEGWHSVTVQNDARRPATDRWRSRPPLPNSEIGLDGSVRRAPVVAVMRSASASLHERCCNLVEGDVPISLGPRMTVRRWQDGRCGRTRKSGSMGASVVLLSRRWREPLARSWAVDAAMCSTATSDFGRSTVRCRRARTRKSGSMGASAVHPSWR